MTISKYLQKTQQNRIPHQIQPCRRTSRQNPTVLPYLRQNRLWSLLNKRQRTSPKTLGKLLWESFCIILPPVLLLTAVGVVAYYILCPSKGEFHADCTDTLYWAKATYDSGKLINPDFSYACLLPFGGSLLMLLFLPLFGFSMTTNMMGMLVFFLLFTTSLC